MYKTIIGLLSAITGLASLGPAQAASVTPDTTDLPKAQSFADLLEPIPNAAALLRVADAAAAARLSQANANLKLAYYRHHHHHYYPHHHHQYPWWWYRQHHHHHNYHHHHHHHHNYHHHHQHNY